MIVCKCDPSQHVICRQLTLQHVAKYIFYASSLVISLPKALYDTNWNSIIGRLTKCMQSRQGLVINVAAFARSTDFAIIHVYVKIFSLDKR